MTYLHLRNFFNRIESLSLVFWIAVAFVILGAIFDTLILLLWIGLLIFAIYFVYFIIWIFGEFG